MIHDGTVILSKIHVFVLRLLNTTKLNYCNLSVLTSFYVATYYVRDSL